jgi:phenylacetate-CoA ligase
LLLNSLFFSVDNVAEYAEILRKYRPRFLKGTASALYYFAFFFKQKGIADIAFEGAFATGEQLMPSQRRLIEEVFHGKVYDSYGHMERTVAISECPHGGFHINPEYGSWSLSRKRLFHPPPRNLEPGGSPPRWWGPRYTTGACRCCVMR